MIRMEHLKVIMLLFGSIMTFTLSVLILLNKAYWYLVPLTCALAGAVIAASVIYMAGCVRKLK